MGLLALSLAACGDSGTGPDTTTIVVLNRSASVIGWVYIADCAVSTWGNDRLGTDEVINPNADRTFAVEPGCWDIRVETLDLLFAEESAVELKRGDVYRYTVTNF